MFNRISRKTFKSTLEPSTLVRISLSISRYHFFYVKMFYIIYYSVVLASRYVTFRHKSYRIIHVVITTAYIIVRRAAIRVFVGTRPKKVAPSLHNHLKLSV